MSDVYRYRVESQEVAGATQFNGLEVRLASEADALVFAGNLATLVSGDVYYSKVLASDYGLPYPDGTGQNARLSVRDASGFQVQMRIPEVAADADLPGLSADLIAAGLKLPVTGSPLATSVVAQLFAPSQSY